MSKHWSSAFILLKHNIKCEVSSKERFFSCLLLASTLLIIFNFSFAGSIASDYALEIFVAEVFVTLLLAMQLSFLKQFDIEFEDNAIESLKLSTISPSIIYLSKYLVSFLVGLCILVPTVLLAFFFQTNLAQTVKLNIQFFTQVLLTLAGLATLGCLISALIQKVSAKEILYPLLFYPLSFPLLIIGLQASYQSLSNPGDWQFLEVMLGLDFVYFLLSLLLFDEVMQ